jgi:hypothetical protein
MWHKLCLTPRWTWRARGTKHIQPKTSAKGVGLNSRALSRPLGRGQKMCSRTPCAIYTALN